MRNLKKLLLLFIGAIVLGTAVSCKPKLKEVKGVVTNVDASRLLDTIHSVRILADNDTLLFTVDQAKFTNGIMIPGDSVTMYYLKGHGDTLRAFVVYAHTKPSLEINTDSLRNNKLLTK